MEYGRIGLHFFVSQMEKNRNIFKLKMDPVNPGSDAPRAMPHLQFPLLRYYTDLIPFHVDLAVIVRKLRIQSTRFAEIIDEMLIIHNSYVPDLVSLRDNGDDS